LKVLITGGAGFIGSHLAWSHLAQQDHVTIVDDLSTGSLQNVANLAGPRFDCHIKSVTDIDSMSELIDSADVIYHLAAAVGVRLILQDQRRSMATNLYGTGVVLQLAARQRKRVILTSTSEVYGKQTRVPFCEDADLVIGPTSRGRWSYACSKAMDEFLALAFWKEARVPVVIARIFNTIGPRQSGRYGMVVPTFVQQALTGQNITVFGDGSQSRCFTHVKDVTRALMAIAMHPDAVGQVFNVGSSNEISILELAHQIKQLTNSRSHIVPLTYEAVYPPDFEDVSRRVPDLSKLSKLIGYEPQVSLQETLLDVIKDMQYRLHESARDPSIQGVEPAWHGAARAANAG